jgi:hypothetical protein
VSVHAGRRLRHLRRNVSRLLFQGPPEAAQAYARLDATLFATRIAPACGITKRFVGEEPLDPMTAAYNDALLSILPENGVAVRVLPRKSIDGAPISASRVRALWKEAVSARSPRWCRTPRLLISGRIRCEYFGGINRPVVP